MAAGLEVPLLLAHVVEPVHFAVSGLPHMPNVEVERRFRAEKALADLALRIPSEAAIRRRSSPTEIRRRRLPKVASDRDAGLIVIGLHASPLLGPRMGSVTYRVLCLTATLVLALPPSVKV